MMPVLFFSTKSLLMVATVSSGLLLLLVFVPTTILAFAPSADNPKSIIQRRRTFLSLTPSPTFLVATTNNRQSIILKNHAKDEEGEEEKDFGSYPFDSLSSSSSFSSSESGGSSSWSVTDHWDDVSNENPLNTVPDSDEIFNRDPTSRIAYRLDQEAYQQSKQFPLPSQDDVWINEQINHILVEEEGQEREGENDAATIGGDNQKNVVVLAAGANDVDKNTNEDVNNFFDEEEMGKELSLLIRCNDRPEKLLIDQGRALAPLTDEEKYNVKQLVNDMGEATPFFSNAIRTIFQQHASSSSSDATSSSDGGGGENSVLDASGVARWLQQSAISVNDETTMPVKGPHDPRVTSVISRYGTYGTGYLTPQDFERLYLAAVLGDEATEAAKNGNTRKDKNFLSRLGKQRTPIVRNVWQELENHGIQSPAQTERERKMQELVQEIMSTSTNQDGDEYIMMDECEIIDEEYLIPEAKSHRKNERFSHQLVTLADDGQTPLYMKDGEFVFIDEESCIGCTQCALAAPASFTMSEYSGRARTFAQRNSPDVAAAVSTCPVNCMHYVSYRELKELETVRENGDGRKDHRHLGVDADGVHRNHTPLHVSGRDSDANRKSSWYHYLRNKCYKSKQCPQRGCYDCPMYQSDPDSNPYFQQRLKKATHIRAKHFMDHGVADPFRKTADL